MSIVIDDPDLERRLRALAAERGESVEEVVRRSLQGSEHSEKAPGSGEQLRGVQVALSPDGGLEAPAWLRELQVRYRTAVLDDESTDDELLGYDADGLPS